MNINIPDHIVSKWQNIVDIMAKILNVPAALIMRIVDNHIEVFVSSKTSGNPYHPGDREILFDSGLYCETVLRENMKLLVPNALVDERWKNNPDVKLNMISYLGFPILWPDKTPFGTICVLDHRENSYSELHESLLLQFRDVIENYLELISVNAQFLTVKTELEAAIDRLETLAATDGLTGIANRRYFDVALDREWRRAIRDKTPLSLLLIDVDHFKGLNDRYGHLHGDETLRKFATLFAKIIRRVNDVVARFGGDEFAILLPNTPAESALRLAETMREAVTQVVSSDITSTEGAATVTIGVASCVPSATGDPMDLLQAADEALYRAKETGRNRVEQQLGTTGLPLP